MTNKYEHVAFLRPTMKGPEKVSRHNPSPITVEENTTRKTEGYSSSLPRCATNDISVRKNYGKE